MTAVQKPTVSPASYDIEHTIHIVHRTKRKDGSLRRDRNMGLRGDWRRHSLQKSTPAHFRKKEDVEEMHGAQHKHDHAYLVADYLEHLTKISGRNPLFQGERHVAEVNEIKTDN